MMYVGFVRVAGDVSASTKKEKKKGKKECKFSCMKKLPGLCSDHVIQVLSSRLSQMNTIPLKDLILMHGSSL